MTKEQDLNVLLPLERKPSATSSSSRRSDQQRNDRTTPRERPATSDHPTAQTATLSESPHRLRDPSLRPPQRSGRERHARRDLVDIEQRVLVFGAAAIRIPCRD